MENYFTKQEINKLFDVKLGNIDMKDFVKTETLQEEIRNF